MANQPRTVRTQALGAQGQLEYLETGGPGFKLVVVKDDKYIADQCSPTAPMPLAGRGGTTSEVASQLEKA